MSLYDSERRYRRRVWGGVIRFVLYVGVVLAAAMVSYEFGAEDIEGQRRMHQEQLLEFEQARAASEQESANLRVEVERAKLALDEWEKRYNADVPTGARRELLDLVNERLEAGVDPNRLAFFIKSAEDKRDCEEVETKRFLVRTPLYNGANTSVTFANDAVAVTGSGESEGHRRRPAAELVRPAQAGHPDFHPHRRPAHRGIRHPAAAAVGRP